VDRERGLFVDRTEAERLTLRKTIERYQEEILGEDSEKRGSEKERGHLKIVLEDPVCNIRMASLASADLAKFRDRVKAADYAPATVVRRLNLIETIIEHARREWRIHLSENPARMVKRPAGADRKRDRVFAPPPERSTASIPADEFATKSEEERLLAARDSDGNRIASGRDRRASVGRYRSRETHGRGARRRRHRHEERRNERNRPGGIRHPSSAHDPRTVAQLMLRLRASSGT
jgi:hypothetical protein